MTAEQKKILRAIEFAQKYAKKSLRMRNRQLQEVRRDWEQKIEPRPDWYKVRAAHYSMKFILSTTQDIIERRKALRLIYALATRRPRDTQASKREGIQLSHEVGTILEDAGMSVGRKVDTEWQQP